MSIRSLLACSAAIASSLCSAAADAQDVGARLAAARERLAAVDSRATRVEDINDIENLQRAYGYYVDKMLWDHVVDLFADDGTLELGQSGVYVGHSSIRDYLYSMSGGRQGPIEGVLYNHLQLQPIITVASNGRTAQGRWRAWVLTGVSGSGGNWGEGPYENTYVKEDGIWKIQSIHWYGNYIAPYEEGWLNADPAALRAHTVSPTMAPDRPPSIDYAPFPGVFVPPFHYANPGRSDGGNTR
jgi:hypothetical protein